MIVDSHCHLDRLKLGDRSLQQAIDCAAERGVGQLLCIAISSQNVEAVLAIAQEYPQVLASVGVHPCDVQEGALDYPQLSALCSRPKVVAVGETGLDYHYTEDTKVQQQESFAMHLTVAGEQQLPVVVHTREAKRDTLALIASHGNPHSAGVLHCFTEDIPMAREAMDMGYYISLSGIVTFRNAEALREVARFVPMERLLVETDSPYLAPVPHRGKPNEPAFVREVAEFLAELKGVSFEQLAQATTNNFYRLFNRAAKPE